MIDGMTIVSAGTTKTDMAAGLMALGCVLCVVFIWTAIESYCECSNAGIIVAICGLVLSIFMVMWGVTRPPIPTIKVILSPDVDMVELMSRYDVQSIDGQIWELTEKNGR